MMHEKVKISQRRCTKGIKNTLPPDGSKNLPPDFFVCGK